MKFLRSQLLVLFVLYAGAALLFFDHYTASSSEYGPGSGQALADFTAYRPFQYRILVPFIAHVLHSSFGTAVQATYALTNVGSMIALLFVYRKFLCFYFSESAAFFYSFGLLYILGWNLCAIYAFRYPSDIPGVFFFAAGLLCLLRKEWLLYYCVLFVGAWNRESILFLVFAYLLVYWDKDDPKTIAKHAGAQLALCLCVKQAIVYIFRHNPGSPYSFTFYDNVGTVIALLQTPFLLLSKLLCIFGGLWILVLVFWRDVPSDVRRLQFLAVPVLLVMLFVGNLQEPRIYNELVPGLMLAAAYVIDKIFADGRGIDPSGGPIGVGEVVEFQAPQ